jgi:hypothetical protein
MDGSRLASLLRQRGALLRQSVLDGRGQAQHWFLGLDQHIALAKLTHPSRWQPVVGNGCGLGDGRNQLALSPRRPASGAPKIRIEPGDRVPGNGTSEADRNDTWRVLFIRRHFAKVLRNPSLKLASKVSR